MDPKADEGGASEDSGQEKSEQGSEEEIGDVDGDDSEEEASENQPTPVASRVRLRSGGDSDSPRAVKRQNLRRQDQHTAGNQGCGVLSALNALDPRVVSTRAAALGVEPRAMYAMYNRVAPMPSASEEERGSESSGGDAEGGSEEGTGQGGQGADEEGDEGDAEADADNGNESSQDPDDDGRGGASEAHEGGDADEGSRSEGGSSQETQGSLYAPSEEGASGSSDA
jgi:hypothetical protein